jgi:hypothetical protein
MTVNSFKICCANDTKNDSFKTHQTHETTKEEKWLDFCVWLSRWFELQIFVEFHTLGNLVVT